jgi:hypothetical protein
LFGGVAVGVVLLAVIGYLFLQKRKSSSPQSGEGSHTNTGAAASIVSSSYAAQVVSAVPIEASTEYSSNVRYEDEGRSAIPIFAPIHYSPPVTYKDQAREHPDAIAIPEAVAVQANAIFSGSSRSIKADPSGIHHDNEESKNARFYEL